MKEITYLIPPRYVTFTGEPTQKPIAVKAWETCVKGLIVQTLIVPLRGKVHLTHKASGTVLAFHVKNKNKAQEMARKLKKLPIDFTAYSPRSLYRQISRLDDRQVKEFREAIGLRKPMNPAVFRQYAKEMSNKFDAIFQKGKRRKPAGSRGRSRKGDTWKGKRKQKSRYGARKSKGVPLRSTSSRKPSRRS